MLECEYSRKLKPETLRGYKATFYAFMKFTPDLTLEEITSFSVTQFFKFLNERKRVVGNNIVKSGVKKSTIAANWSHLNVFFEWLKIKKLIEANPFTGMQYPTPAYEERKYLNRRSLEKILTAIWTHSKRTFILKRNLVIFYILLFCGLRREELILLQVQDINLERKILTVRAETSKTPRTRYIPLHSKVIFHLKDYLNERKHLTTQYLVASSSRDEKLSLDGLKHLVTELKKASREEFHLHQFRHTFAVNFLNRGGDISKLKQLLGHKDITMTIHYLRCLPPNLMRGDIENMNLDNFI